jgi:WD40 repeat protein/serine/threonine protein kinase
MAGRMTGTLRRRANFVSAGLRSLSPREGARDDCLEGCPMLATPQVNDILARWEAARHLSPEELCASCPELLAEVRTHIRALQRMEAFMETGPDASPLPSTVDGGPPTGDAAPSGKLPAIPGYEIMGELGHGGMGIVYQARQGGLKRLVALKMIKADSYASPQDLARFQAEAEAVARLQHPNIVQVYEIGQHEERPYFAMEFIDGGSLHQKLKELKDTTVPARDGAQWLEILARAVHHAHEHGIVHRDLKPANVLQTKDGTLKVTDFGLAKDIGADKGQTATGSVLGTPCYMAPEQAAGRIKEIGPATDVYALGAILYEFLTGRPPFTGETLTDILLQVANDEPVPPRQLQPNAPLDLDTICLRCLEKSPARRYASALALADELRRFLSHEPIHARPLSTWSRGLKWARRKPAQAVAVLLMLLLVIGLGVGFAVVSWQLGETEKALGSAERAKKAEGEARDGEKKRREEAEAAERKATDRADDLENSFYDDRVAMAHREWQDNHLAKTEKLLAECPRRWRGWEWQYIQRLLPRPNTGFWQHKAVIASVAFSPDGKRVASTDSSGALKIWDASTYQECLVLPARHESCAAVFSPDGKHLAVACSGATVKLWDAVTGKLGSTLEPATKDLSRNLVVGSAVTYTRDGAMIAAGNRDGSVVVWDTRTSQMRHDFRKHRREVYSLAFSPDGAVLAIASGFQIVIVDLQEGNIIRTMQPGEVPVLSVAFSPDGKRLASANSDGVLKTWNPSTGQEVLTMAISKPTLVGEPYRGQAYSIAYSHDGTQLASAHADTTVRVWDAETGQELLVVRRHAYAATALAYSPDGKRLATGGADLAIRISDVTSLPESLTLPGQTAAVTRVMFSPDGKSLASSCADGSVRLWNTRTWQEPRVMKKHTKPVNGLAFSPDSQQLATGSYDKSVTLWDVQSGGEVRSFSEHTGGVLTVAFSPDGKNLASAGWSDLPPNSTVDNECKIWDLKTGQKSSSVTSKAREMFSSISYSPDGKTLAGAVSRRGVALAYGRTFQNPDLKGLAQVGPHTAGRVVQAGMFFVWDVQSGKPLLSLKGHPAQIQALVFSRDGTLIATAGRDGTVKLWDTSTGKERFTLHGHGGPVNSVEFSKDGKRLVSGSNDRTVKLWDTMTGKELFTLRGHTDAVASVAFSPDGHRIASASADKTVKIWDGTPLPEVSVAK